MEFIDLFTCCTGIPSKWLIMCSSFRADFWAPYMEGSRSLTGGKVYKKFKSKIQINTCTKIKDRNQYMYLLNLINSEQDFNDGSRD